MPEPRVKRNKELVSNCRVIESEGAGKVPPAIPCAPAGTAQSTTAAAVETIRHIATRLVVRSSGVAVPMMDVRDVRMFMNQRIVPMKM